MDTIGYFFPENEVHVIKDKFFQTKIQIHFDNDNSQLQYFQTAAIETPAGMV